MQFMKDKPCDVNLLKSMNPFSKQDVDAFLASQHPGESIVSLV